MKMNYEGKQRKELAAAITEITGTKAMYMKAPTYAYQIGIFMVRYWHAMETDDIFQKILNLAICKRRVPKLDRLILGFAAQVNMDGMFQPVFTDVQQLLIRHFPHPS